MKLSETPEEQREGHLAYVDQRWTQLSDLELSWSTDAIKYLMLVNSGATIAVLTFFGAIETVRPLLWPKVMLGFFVVGVVIIGIFHAVRYHRIDRIYRSWREGVDQFYSDKLDWEKMISDDENLSRRFPLGVTLAYLAFGCFLGGVIVGLCNFSSLS